VSHPLNTTMITCLNWRGASRQLTMQLRRTRWLVRFEAKTTMTREPR
jgi:hypothetical protein